MLNGEWRVYGGSETGPPDPRYSSPRARSPREWQTAGGMGLSLGLVLSIRCLGDESRGVCLALTESTSTIVSLA